MTASRDLRHSVDVEQRSQVADGSGGKSWSAWSLFGTRWAEIKIPSATQIFRFGQIGQEVTHTIRMRHESSDLNIQRGWRLKWTVSEDGGTTPVIKYLEILDVIRNFGRLDYWTDLTCREFTP